MSKKNQKVFISTGQEGHLSIALAAKQALDQAGYKTTLHHSVMDIAHKTYLPFYRMFPKLFKIPYELSQFQAAQSMMQSYVNNSKEGKHITKALNKHKPDMIVSTWYATNHILAEYAQNHQIPFFNIITDPRTFSDVIPQKDSFNLTFDHKTSKYIENELNIKKENIIQAGWFIRNQFEAPYSQAKTKKSLGIPRNELTFLVCGGSDGANAVLKIIPAFINENEKINIYFVCGSNKTLYKTVKGFAKIFQATQSNINIIPIGFTNELEKYMQAADLVIGKAGPNLLFETVATQTPFFAITHISGQEDGNLEIIEENNLGYVEEKSLKAIKLIQQIINNPKQLKSFSTSLKKMKQHNHKAKEILIKSIQANSHSAS